MTIDLFAVAVIGVGYPPITLATDGFIILEEAVVEDGSLLQRRRRRGGSSGRTDDTVSVTAMMMSGSNIHGSVTLSMGEHTDIRVSYESLEKVDRCIVTVKLVSKKLLS